MTVGNGVEQVVWSAHDAELVQSIALHMASAVAHARLHEAIKESAITDPLTGVANRRGWFMVAQSHWEQAQRQPPLAVALLDADHFKRVNDTYGHAVGDQVLQILALRCREMVRAMDLVGRYGGEEFVILLPTADAPTAAMVAERIRLAVSSTPFPTTAGPLPITVSLGVAVAHDTYEPLAQLLEQADAALYAAKRHGRNQVRVWTATPPAP